MREIEFERHEYSDTPKGVKMLIKTIVEKLPEPKRRKYRQLNWENHVLQKEADLLRDGIDAALLTEWLNHNVSQTAQGRQASVIYKMLVALQALGQDAGIEMLNAALAKNLNTGRPQTCTMGYLGAILRSERAAGRDKGTTQSKAQQPTSDEAWARMMHLLKQRINANSYNTWLRPLRLKSLTSRELHVWCPSEVHQNWLSEHYQGVFAEVCHTVLRRALSKVVFCVEGRDA